MPPAQTILDQLSGVAQHWWPLAIAWHVLVATFVIALLCGWRPSTRIAGTIIGLPVASAAGLAAVSVNPFTTVVLAGALAGTQIAVWRAASKRAHLAGAGFVVAGAALVAFGLVYPHFLGAGASIKYLYAAPMGLVPCPTLCVVAGFSLIFGSFGSKSWAMTVSATGLLYGAIGVFYLGVQLDWALVGGALLTLVQSQWPKPERSAHASAA